MDGWMESERDGVTEKQRERSVDTWATEIARSDCH